ncbi:MAG: hypothetical protein EXX96DRAFT_565832 [Benjaminiella poitrasii]|nr:MAG: hypothetical protein EXX96DRAFT_565832 [Benjaminiella poitrasii]
MIKFCYYMDAFFFILFYFFICSNMDNRVLELYQKRSSNLRFLNPPKHTDSTEMKESRLGLTESQLLKRAKLLSMTGRAVYKKRIGQDEELAILRQLPKGYYVRFDEQDRMTVHGHPSGRCYKNPSSFIPHILWLEDYKSKNQPSIRACECSLCKQYGAPSKEVTEKLMKKQKSKSANDQLSEHLNV